MEPIKRFQIIYHLVENIEANVKDYELKSQSQETIQIDTHIFKRVFMKKISEKNERIKKQFTEYIVLNKCSRYVFNFYGI